MRMGKRRIKGIDNVKYHAGVMEQVKDKRTKHRQKPTKPSTQRRLKIANKLPTFLFG